MSMKGKWFWLLVIFVLSLVGLETYHNIALMYRGYLIEKMRLEKKKLERERDYLREKLSFSLSLVRIEAYSREKLGFIDPRDVRFLKENFSPPEESSSPPPSGIEDFFFKWLKLLKNCINNFFSS